MQIDEQLPALSVQIPTTTWPTKYNGTVAPAAAVAMQKATSSSSTSSTATPRPTLGQRSLSHRLVASKLAAAAACAAASAQPLSDDEEEEEYGAHASRSSSPSSSCSSSSTSEPLRRFLAAKRRHSRSTSAPEQPQHTSSSSLHVDTFLPLQLPPRELCASSPLLAYPASWWAKSDEKASATTFDAVDAVSAATTDALRTASSVGASLRRSESLASFISANSDGSWHGDQGDEDPDGQLARALHEMNKREKKSSSAVRSSRAGSGLHKVDDGALRDYINDEYVHGHGPLHVSTHDYEDEDDFAQHTGTYETEKLQVQPLAGPQQQVPDTPTVIRTLGDYHMSASAQHHHTAPPSDDDDDELAIVRHAGPVMARMAAMLFNLDEAITADGKAVDAFTTSPFERRISRSFSDPSSPAQLGVELGLRRRHRRYSRRRAATVGVERNILAYSEYDVSGSKRGHLAALWKWFLPDVDTYLPPGLTHKDDADNDDVDDWLTRHMKWSASVPSLVLPDEDDDDDDVATPVDSDVDDDSPDQHPCCYGESARRKSGFGVSSFESSAFEDGSDHVGRQRSSSSSTFLLRSLSHSNLSATAIRPHPSPLWDNKLTEEPYSRSWSSMFGLTALTHHH